VTPGAPQPDGAPAGDAAREIKDIEEMDPGLARERTELSWTRSAISFAALGGAMLKATPLAGAVVLAASTLVWGTGRLARSAASRHGRRDRLLLVITVAVTAVSLGALVLALLGGRTVPLR